ncbi:MULTISPECIES: hypothetical protein [Desulfobacula]|uniref:Uncharacterized protein n=2 Tax=Desulfobacula TaxID=28222 RepID=K0NFY8_DESTT|nr:MULTISPECIES: hypothetical protein [Desulfobacula]CCK78683.1 uncharacterized protein TOL2_C05150 [Desulfobacula toluolica Tol2]SDT88169.1 hypothetical protein SAMN04487931_102349 [Desulfobacula phenolica]
MVVFEEGFEPLSTRIHDSILIRLKNQNNESFILNDSEKKYLVGISEIKLTKGGNGMLLGEHLNRLTIKMATRMNHGML